MAFEHRASRPHGEPRLRQCLQDTLPEWIGRSHGTIVQWLPNHSAIGKQEFGQGPRTEAEYCAPRAVRVGMRNHAMGENQRHISLYDQHFPDSCTSAMPQHTGFFRQGRHAPLHKPAHAKVMSDAANMRCQRAPGCEPGRKVAIRRQVVSPWFHYGLNFIVRD